MKGFVRSSRKGEKVKYLKFEIRLASDGKGMEMMREVLHCLVTWPVLLCLGVDVSPQQGPPGCTCALRKHSVSRNQTENINTIYLARRERAPAGI